MGKQQPTNNHEPTAPDPQCNCWRNCTRRKWGKNKLPNYAWWKNMQSTKTVNGITVTTQQYSRRIVTQIWWWWRKTQNSVWTEERINLQANKSMRQRRNMWIWKPWFEPWAKVQLLHLPTLKPLVHLNLRTQRNIDGPWTWTCVDLSTPIKHSWLYSQ